MPIIPWKLQAAPKDDANGFMGTFRAGLQNLTPVDYRHKNGLAARTMVEEMLAVPKTAILIDRPPGTADTQGIVVFRNEAPILRILFLCVKPEGYRKGLGRQLLQAVQALGEKHGLGEVRVR